MFVLNKDKDRSIVRIISVPITGFRTKDTIDPFIQTNISISAFALPDVSDLHHVNIWKSLETVVSSDLNLCHLGRSVDLSTSESSSDSGLLLACLQGAMLYEHTENDQWKEYPVTQLLPPIFDSSEYTGLCAIGQLKWKNEFLYPFIAPFHDGHVGFIYNQSVYELDFVGKGGHDVQAGKFDSDAFDIEFFTAFWGSDPGIILYSLPKHKDPFKMDNWIKTKIYNLPVSMMTLGDFNGDGRLDVASINAGSHGDSSVVIHYNLAPPKSGRVIELWMEEFDEN